MAEEKAKILEGLQDPIEEKATETISETIDDAKDFAELQCMRHGRTFSAFDCSGMLSL